MKDKKDHKKQDSLWDEWNGEYIGNVWGWRFSYISLAIILFVGALMLLRYWQVSNAPKEKIEQVQPFPDSLSNPKK